MLRTADKRCRPCRDLPGIRVKKRDGAVSAIVRVFTGPEMYPGGTWHRGHERIVHRRGHIVTDVHDEQPVRVQDICGDLERRFGPAVRAKTLKLRVDTCPRIVVTDPTLLRGMLSNLVSNAIRYTSHGEVHIECSIGTDNGVSLAVHDTGIGISPEHVHTIFEDFYRTSEAKDATAEGFGLGLGIVRRLSRLLGLVVTVQSEVGKGSTFTVHIPPKNVFAIPDQNLRIEVAKARSNREIEPIGARCIAHG